MISLYAVNCYTNRSFMADTIFQKIIAGEIPATFVYEDEMVVAFLDSSPVHPGHTLVVPREPVVNMFDADPAIIAHMAQVAQQIAQALQTVVKADGVNLHMNNGAAAGQEVFHAHMHVVPRYTDDGSYQKPVKRTYEDTGSDATALGEQLSQELSRTKET